ASDWALDRAHGLEDRPVPPPIPSGALRCAVSARKYRLKTIASGTSMAVIIDTVLGDAGRPRHPEKAHRPNQPSQRKPDWIRVEAPVSAGYVATREIVRAQNLHTVCEEAG